MKYNDGTLIEPEKFEQTAIELCDQFGGIAQDTVRTIGIWKYEGLRYRDELFRIHIDTDDPRAVAWLRSVKGIWKERFRQIDIWITAYDIKVI